MERSRQALLVLALAALTLTAGCLDGVVGPSPTGTPESTDTNSSATPVVTSEEKRDSSADGDASPPPSDRPPASPDSIAGSDGHPDSSDIPVPATPRTPGTDLDTDTEVDADPDVGAGRDVDAGSDIGGDEVPDSGASNPVVNAPAPVADDSPVVPSGGGGSEPPSTDPPATEDTDATGTVVGVVDGDTIRVQFDDGRLGTVDLAGVDAPELYSSTDPALFSPVPNSERGMTYLHAWGWTADRAIASRLLDESVAVQIVDSYTAADLSAESYLTYETSETVYVAYVTLEGSSSTANLALVEAGLARATRDDHPQRARFAAAETDAREAAVGLWDVSEPLSVP